MRCSGSARAVSIRIGTCEFAPERAGEVEAGFMRHHHVENEQIEGEAAHGGARGGRIDGRGHAEAVLLQIAGEQVADAAVVVDDEDMWGELSSGARPRWSFDRRWHRHDASAFPSSSTVAGDEDMMEETLGRSSALIMACRKRRSDGFGPGARGPQGFGEAHELRRGEPLRPRRGRLRSGRAAARAGRRFRPPARYSPGR